MESIGAGEALDKAVDHRALAVAVIDISADVRRKSHNDTGVRPLSNLVDESFRMEQALTGQADLRSESIRRSSPLRRESLS